MAYELTGWNLAWQFVGNLILSRQLADNIQIFCQQLSGDLQTFVRQVVGDLPISSYM